MIQDGDHFVSLARKTRGAILLSHDVRTYLGWNEEVFLRSSNTPTLAYNGLIT